MLKENQKYHLLLFLISPVLGLIYGIRTKKKSYIRWSIFIFVILYGSVMHPSHLGDGESHYEALLKNYIYLSSSEFWDRLLAILSLKPTIYTNDDPYLHFLSYFVGTILNSPNLLFLFVAVPFGYFYSGAIVKLLDHVDWYSKYNKFYFAFFLALFLLWQTPGDMQSIRNGTAVWVVIYALISYQNSKNKKYLVLLLLTPIIHLAFTILMIPFLVVLLSGYRNPKVYFIIFMFSVLTSNIVDSDAANDVVSQTEMGAKKVQGYTVDEERVENRAIAVKEGGGTFYKKYQALGIGSSVLTGLIIFMFIVLRNKGFGQLENTLFSYGLAGASFGNFLNFNYAIHNRVWGIASILILALLLVFLSKQNLRNISFSFLKVKIPLFLCSIAFVPLVLFKISANLNFTSLYILIMPAVMWIDFDMGISIRGFIGLFM